jgi:sulfur carrier protein
MIRMELSAVTIQLNGEQRGVKGGMTVAGLLRELDIKPDRVAVELNLEIVDRQAFETRRLQEGDRLEILSFIGGGVD